MRSVIITDQINNGTSEVTLPLPQHDNRSIDAFERFSDSFSLLFLLLLLLLLLTRSSKRTGKSEVTVG